MAELPIQKQTFEMNPEMNMISALHVCLGIGILLCDYHKSIVNNYKTNNNDKGTFTGNGSKERGRHIGKGKINCCIFNLNDCII